VVRNNVGITDNGFKHLISVKEVEKQTYARIYPLFCGVEVKNIKTMRIKA